MRRDHALDGEAPRSLVVAGWICALALPPVGIVLGMIGLRKTEPATRAQGALILAVSLTGLVMWVLVLAGGTGGRFLFAS